MLGTKKTTQKSVLGGIGMALLLCLLMALMPMSGFVTNDVDGIDFVNATEESQDYFKLPETIENTDYEYDQALELKGMRDQMTKAYITEDGSIAQLIANEPINYLQDDGVWDEIDLNVVATANGWEVTKNTYTAEFAAEVAGGVKVQVNQFVDPIYTGINPTVVTIDESGVAPMPLMIAPSTDGPTVGGNVIRYPIAEGYDLDYTVESTQLKQNLVIRERPVLQPNAAWLGISEAVQLPLGYSLYIGDTLIGEEITQTQEALQIRHTETGELLAEFPVPMVVEEGAEAPYVATYFVQSYGSLIILTTAVDTDWLLSEDRVFPLAIDPTIKVLSNTGGYCYVYYADCYTSSYRYLYRNYATNYYLPWHKYNFNSNHAIPSGATVDSIKWKQYVSYAQGSSSTVAISATVMESCGTDVIYDWAITTASCSGAFSASNLVSGYGGTAQMKMQSSIWNSPVVDTYAQGTGWKTADICTTATTCSSGTAAGYITSAQTNSGTIGMGAKMTSSIYTYTYAYTVGSSNSYLEIVYSGGTDADAPTSDFAPYSGITSYAEGSRTFFTTFSDMSGIDTTSANGPTLNYALNNGTWTSVSATTIGTCSSTTSDCKFKATTPSVDAGDYLEYYWKFQDLNQGSNGANVGYDPVLTGAQTTPTPYYFAVEDVADAGTDQKMTVSTTDVSGGGYNYPTVLDRQMTYYDGSDEYIFEFDTSSCGTGTQACFDTTSYYFYANWLTQWTTAPSTGSNGMGGTRSGIDQLHEDDGGYLAISAKNGPQYTLIMLYDSSSNSWAMVGLGDKATSSTSLEINDPLSGGTAATKSLSYGYNSAYKIAIPGGITGSFGKFNWNATGSSTSANMLCVTDNGAYYFYRTYSGTGSCSSAYYYFGAYNSITSYTWSGFVMSLGYYGQQASTGTVTYKVGLVAPQPDTFAPTMQHSALSDSHSKDRTVAVTITDAGDPPSGLNVSTTTGVGPTLYYRAVGASTWSSMGLTQESGKTRAQCAGVGCTWSAAIPTLERGDEIEYYVTAQDTSTASSGVNAVTSSTNSFEVGDPTKMMIIEWRDMGYTTSYLCTYQVVMYDVTNEIEFKYDTGCGVYYDYMSTGYQDSTRTKGEALRTGTGSYQAGANIFSNNFRISTSATSYGHETFDLGIKDLQNAQAAIVGSSAGNPTAYDCSYQFNNYKSQCAANIDIPDGFAIEYFGTEFNGSDSNDRIHISRHGIMQLINSGSTSTYRSLGSYYSVPGAMPSTDFYAKTNTLAPNWGGYGSYYCYKTTSVDCGVYWRVMPFEGKGTDVESDITVDTNWDLADSPIRINPSNDYLSISANLQIEPGVVIQVASGKGISFDGACDTFTANGNVTDHILFEGQAGATWAGLAFTNSCSTGTDDRHQFSYVDFANTTDAAIAAGSRHGTVATPSSNANVGNFTMNHMTFKNVASAFEHGSGQGTVVTMSDFSVEGSTTANTACFNFAEDTIATLTEGTMKDCNTAGTSWGGAIVIADGASAGSTGGSLFLENTTITNSYVNLIDVDLSMVTISNVTANTASAQTGSAIASSAGAGSEVVLFNFDADDYASASIDAIGLIHINDVDLGTANLAMTPGGSSSTAAGPSGANAVIDTLTSGDIQMNRMHPSVFTDVSAGDIGMYGNAITTDVLDMANFAIGAWQLTGCGWNVNMDAINADLVYSSCSSSAAPNTVVVSDGTITHTNSVTSALYARNTKMTVGETAITSTTAGTGTIYLAKASTNAQILLIDVTQDGNDCADNNGDSSNCDYEAASSATIWFGGTAQASTYRIALMGTPPVSTQIWKSGHTVTASVVDGSGSELFEVGSHVTDMNGAANVWVVTGDSNGNTYSDHNIRAFGPAGQNETMYTDAWYPASGDFNIGSSIDLLLEPSPVDFDQSGMDCAWMAQNATLMVMDTGNNVYEFDSTPMTLSADLHLDGCTIKLLGSVLKVKSTATSSPVLTLSNGGSLIVTTSVDTGAVGSLKAITSTYGLHLDIQDGGTLEIDGGIVRDVAQDATTNSAILIGDGATLTMMNGATIFGSSASADDMATVKVDGGTINVDDSSIINTGNTGTALWVEQSGGNINNILVKNGAVGIQSYNGAPQINGFTSTDNTVGVDVYGGMSLPTIYRSTLLSGKATGWETYEIDLSTYLGTGDYLQVGANSIYGGGNAHPTYNYATSKYYMMTDRYNIQLEDDAGNSWNITQGDDLGYYPYSTSDPASGVGYAAAYDGGSGGVPSYDCNYYGYSYGPNAPTTQDGYMYYLWYYWPGGPMTSPSYPAYYNYPAQFGFDWENIVDVSPTGNAAYYPYHYWGYSYTSYHGGAAGTTFAPPEGYNGLFGYYNICLDYAYSYYMNAGQGARLTYPIVDISAGNITKVTLWMDVLHNRADNYQDRLDFVARSGNDPADLGNYVRESGTALFKDGTITGADTGIEVGGAFAAAHFDNVDVTSPVNAGMEIVGQTAATTTGLTVTGGTYGVLSGTSASGSIDLLDLDLNGQTSAGIYYVKDITGELSGTITNSAGAAFKYGPLSARDVSFDSVTIQSNAIGVETAGTGKIIMQDVTMGNTVDVSITRSALVDFIEGTINLNAVSVTGSGEFTRMRELTVTLTADSSAVPGATVNLLDASGSAAGTGTTDINGQVNGLTFTTATVDNGGVTIPSLSGYQVSTVAEIDYYYTSSSNNLMDFRYAFESATLTDTSGNSETVDLVDQITDRVCYDYASTSYVMVAQCTGYLSTAGSRDMDTDGDGVNDGKEYGYYGGLAKDMSNKTLMVDVPFMYINGGDDYNFNGSTILATGGYEPYDTQRWYPKSPYGSSFYMTDGSMYSMMVNPTSGSPMGIELGYQYYSLNLIIDNSTLSGIASIVTSNGYTTAFYTYNWEVEEVSITNSDISHYRGYTSLNNAILYTDICIVLGGGDGGVISDNTFNNCGVGVMAQRSPYYSYHTADYIGADNLTVSGNTFNNGGEIADVWIYTNAHADDAVITGNTFNSDGAAGSAIAVYPGNNKRIEISDNIINGANDGIYVRDVADFSIDNNTVFGVGDSSKPGISVRGGQGDVTNNTLVDADGGIVLDSMSQPPAPQTTLCTIRSYDYSYDKSCTFTLASGKTLAIDLETDSWGGEIGLEITKPDGTTDTWAAGSFSSQTGYTPLVTYTAAGNYTVKVTDTYGDGGANMYALESSGGAGYNGPDISGNTIGLSAGRISPNAVGITAMDCSSVDINSAGNSITLSDNAIVLEDCDFNDNGSVLTGDGTSLTNGIISADGVNAVSLLGTSISGYDTGVEMPSGTLNLLGAATISGATYGVHAIGTTVTAINAAVDGGSAGTGLYVEDSSDVWVYPLDASGVIGVHIVNSPFRWDGGTVDATTALKVDESVGTVENMTWTSSTQIDAGSNAYITSIGNSLNASKLIVHPTATIDEANLFSMASTHLTATPTNEVSLLIQSTDGTRASYVSTSFQPENMVVDGDDSDWNGGNALNPSGYAMPGVMSGDGTNDMSMTYIEGDNLYFGLTGEDLTNSDLLIYISTDGSGSTTGYNGMGGAHTLPVPANYVLWADSETSYALYSYGFLGWGPTSLSQDAVSVDFSGDFAEISIPFSRMGGTPSQIDVVAIVQGESTADVSTVHPTQTINSSNTLQSFSDYITVELTHDDLLTGVIADEVLVYRTYKGSNTPSVAKDYDVMVKTSADCAYDWAISEDVSMAANVNLVIDMERACPVIGTSLADITVDEDSGAYTFSLTNMADDVQDDEATMSWTSADSNLVAHDNVLVDWNQNGHQVTITPLDNQFGTMTYSFEVTDSNGLTDSKNITFAVDNVNDAPVICNVGENDCMPLFSEDVSFNNILPEGFGSHIKSLGDVSNATRSYIRDMANEQSPTRQVYTWGASVPATCIAFSAEVNTINELVLTENTNNELGGTCTVTLTLSDDGAENQDANDFDVEFSVSPVNDAPVILDWNASMVDDEGRTVSVNPDNGSVNTVPWKLSVMEDDTSADNLTFSLASMKDDIDHNDADLTWEIESTDQCVYGNYFDATIVGDDLVLDLVADATTNGYDWEVDYLNDNGIHQIGPTGSDYCQIRLVLRDTGAAPSYVPNYDTALMPIADYQQGVATQEIGIRVERVRELVADYGFSANTGFSFNGVNNIMTGTYVPVTVDVTAGGDEGPYTYDHMLAITYHTDGHSEIEQTRYYAVPAYGTSVAITEDVYITKDTTNVWVEMDVKTCLTNPCDVLVSATDRFQTDSPASHRSNNQGQQGADWSKPGQYGSNATQTSERRPLLEDSNWCNNMMSSLSTAATCAHANQPSSTFEASGQNLPVVVGTIGAGAVPSFAPSIIAVSLAGVFVGALALSGRREEDEEALEESIVDDERAVSPVIATILMVAITVVLSGVIYVWASSLAETDVKGVPRVTFNIEDINGADADQGHWRISVTQSETDLATQAVEVRVFYVDASGSPQTFSANLADTNDVYGFNPANSDAFVTFVDQVNKEGTRSVSTFNTGDEIYVRTHAPDGTPMTDVTITLSYAPANAQGALLRSWSGLAYDLQA